MNFELLEKQFNRMGAKVAFANRPAGFGVDIRRNGRNTSFEISVDESIKHLFAQDVQPQKRHLLLVANKGSDLRYLCGHDERDWFAAAVPGKASVTTVQKAMEALKPVDVQAAQSRIGIRLQNRNRRHNEAFIRQGEWFFVPVPEKVVDRLYILQNERLIRGRGKPHMVDELVRTRGEVIYYSAAYPQGIREARYQKLIRKSPEKRALPWQVMRINPEVYVRGRVRHPDHKTIRLDIWHRVFTNTENEAPAMRHLVFID